MDAERGAPCNRLFYLAIPPEQYESVVDCLGSAGLSQAQEGCGMWRASSSKSRSATTCPVPAG